jgi:predicted phosphodiesterase
MKVAVVADIHGNSAALGAVLDDARRLGATRLVVLGDIVGYYYGAREAVELIEAWDAVVIRGNHEELLQQWLEGDAPTRDTLRRRYGSGLAVAAEVLDAPRLVWLRRLPHPVEQIVGTTRTLFAHGHPTAVDVYVYPDNVQSLLDRTALGSWDLVWLGHTHYPMDTCVGETRVVNPGSVGQPRDGDPRAAWALWDTESGEVELLRTAYRQAELLAEVARRDPDVPYMAQVLTRSHGAT